MQPSGTARQLERQGLEHASARQAHLFREVESMRRPVSPAFAAELRTQLRTAYDDLMAADAAGEELVADLARDRIDDLLALADRNGVSVERPSIR